LYEEISIIVENEPINLSIINDLPLEFISNINLKTFSFKIDKKKIILDYLNEANRNIYDIPHSMYSILYDFQKKGIEFGISKNCRFLLADEMGVGKTIQAIGCSVVFKQDWPVLIICPSSLKYNWKDEIFNWLNDIIKREEIQIIKKSQDDFSHGRKFYIISYDLCLRMEKKLQDKEFNFIIADEAHYLKSRDSKRAKLLIPLMQKSKRLILLSGTPIVSRPSECFNLLKCLRPDIFNKFLIFAERYCDPKIGPWGKDYSGSSNIKELNFILNNLMIRRLKKDVLSELPPKKRQKVPINTNDKVIKQIKVLLDKSRMKIPEDGGEGIFNDDNSTFSKAYSLTGQAKIIGIQEYINYLIESILNLIRK
jgi:SWI/SNF-related matrix-associated actin-dependent regulator 1 of chromatin subfamily A